jgi:hypothetical protein
MFSKVKKGSQTYKKILQPNSEFTFAPKNTIEKGGELVKRREERPFTQKLSSSG